MALIYTAKLHWQLLLPVITINLFRHLPFYDKCVCINKALIPINRPRSNETVVYSDKSAQVSETFAQQNIKRLCQKTQIKFQLILSLNLRLSPDYTSCYSTQTVILFLAHCPTFQFGVNKSQNVNCVSMNHEWILDDFCLPTKIGLSIAFYVGGAIFAVSHGVLWKT